MENKSKWRVGMAISDHVLQSGAFELLYPCKIPSYIHVQNGVICLHFHRFVHISFVHFKLVIFLGLKNIHKNNEPWNEAQTHIRVWERFENRMIKLSTDHILKHPDGFRESRLDAIWDIFALINCLLEKSWMSVVKEPKHGACHWRSNRWKY